MGTRVVLRECRLWQKLPSNIWLTGGFRLYSSTLQSPQEICKKKKKIWGDPGAECYFLMGLASFFLMFFSCGSKARTRYELLVKYGIYYWSKMGAAITCHILREPAYGVTPPPQLWKIFLMFWLTVNIVPPLGLFIMPLERTACIGFPTTNCHISSWAQTYILCVELLRQWSYELDIGKLVREIHLYLFVLIVTYFITMSSLFWN